MYPDTEFACDILLNYATQDKPKGTKFWASQIYVHGDHTYIEIDLGGYGFDRANADLSDQYTLAENAYYIAKRFFDCEVFEDKPKIFLDMKPEKSEYELSLDARLFVKSANERLQASRFSHEAILKMRTLLSPEQIKEEVRFECPIFMESEYHKAYEMAKGFAKDKGFDPNAHPEASQ